MNESIAATQVAVTYALMASGGRAAPVFIALYERACVVVERASTLTLYTLADIRNITMNGSAHSSSTADSTRPATTHGPHIVLGINIGRSMQTRLSKSTGALDVLKPLERCSALTMCP